MKYKGIELNKKQTEAAKAIISGESCSIQAPAGSGKTLTLLTGARRLKGYGLNISFNKSVAIQAEQKFPRNIVCKTGHALAFASVGRKYSHRLKKLTGASLANTFDLGSPHIFQTQAKKGYYILQTIRNYCYSNDTTINESHIPIIPKLINKEIRKKVNEDILFYSDQVWKEQIDLNSEMPISHDTYLKLWALTNPIIKKDFILFDEAQDANPVMLDIILNQDCQKVFVGDRFQQIYSWRGAVNAFNQIQYKKLFLTQSFRFGQEIADVANDIIYSYAPPEERIPRILGNKNKKAFVYRERTKTIPDCILCRTNANVITTVMSLIKQKYKTYILGGADRLIGLINGIQDIKQTGKSYQPELYLFNNYDELIEYTETPFGGDLKYLIKILEKNSADKIISTLCQTEQNEKNAEIIVTTTHKAKGLEWPKVYLSSDFRYPEENEYIPTEEVSLLYVAVTRALNILSLINCPALDPINLQIGREFWNKEK